MPRSRSTFRQRIPHEHEGVQVNFCKKPDCPNFGIPAQVNIKGLKLPLYTDPVTGKKHRDAYTLSKGFLVCHACGSEIPLKSNKGVFEEFQRISTYLAPVAVPETTCPDRTCANHGIPVSAGSSHYYRYGTQSSGARRFRCLACKKSFSVNSNPAKKQRKRDLNDIIFRLLVNKMPLQRICEVAQISMPTLYDKIDFFYRQCLAFAGSHERRLADLNIVKLQVSVDRQEYIVNWSNTNDKRNTRINAIGSADNRSGFVFGMHLNIDTEAKKEDVEDAAKRCGDMEKDPAFREHARFWLDKDYEVLSRQKLEFVPSGKAEVIPAIAESDAELSYRADVEAFEQMNATVRLPKAGMLIHGEYTMYGHFMLLRKLLPKATKIRFYMEKESGIRAACFAAFHDDIRSWRCNAFYLKINKEMTINQKNVAMAHAQRDLEDFRGNSKYYQDVSDNSLRALMFDNAISAGDYFLSTPYKDKWYLYPAPPKNEPEKAVSWLTDLGDRHYRSFHVALLMLRASLHGIDRFFMQVRRRISLLERPIKTSSSTGRTWYGYSPYNPAHVVKLLEIFRVYHNYVHATANVKRRILKKDEKKRNPGEVQKTMITPAMRLRLVERKYEVADILAFR